MGCTSLLKMRPGCGTAVSSPAKAYSFIFPQGVLFRGIKYDIQ